jgi:hypothetical protein
MHERLRDYQREATVTGTPRVFPFAVRDTESNEGGAAEQCVIMQAPNVQHGVNASMREWRIFAGRFIWNQVNYE